MGKDKKYWEYLERIQKEKANHNYEKMLDYCEKSLPYIEQMVKSTIKEYGTMDIVSIPALEIGAKYWAVQKQTEKINNLESIINGIEEIRDDWIELLEIAKEEMDLAIRIENYIKDNPGVLQNKLGKTLGVSGYETKSIVTVIENLKIVRKAKHNKTYELYIMPV